MRITESMITSSYNRNLQNNLSNMNASFTRLTSKRQFNHVSEAPAQAAKAFAARRQIAKNEEYTVAAGNAASELQTASDNIMNLSSLFDTIYEQASKAGGIKDQDSLNAIADTLKGMKEEVLSLMNVQYGNKYLFGGTNTESAPFTVDDSGALLYNGVSVDGYDPADPNTHFPSDKDMYLDIGYASTGLNADHRGIKISTSGAEVLGYGTDSTGRVNNIYSILDKMENQLRAGDQTGAIESLENLKDKQSNITTAVSEIGSRQNMLERTTDRLSAELLTLQKRQESLESVKMEEEATEYKTLQNAWEATLQIGSNLILPSIFDFMS